MTLRHKESISNIYGQCIYKLLLKSDYTMQYSINYFQTLVSAAKCLPTGTDPHTTVRVALLLTHYLESYDLKNLIVCEVTAIVALLAIFFLIVYKVTNSLFT